MENKENNDITQLIIATIIFFVTLFIILWIVVNHHIDKELKKELEKIELEQKRKSNEKHYYTNDPADLGMRTAGSADVVQPY